MSNALRYSLTASTAIALILSVQAASAEPSSQTTTTLPKVTVVADFDDGSDGYKTNSGRSSTRTDTPLLDVPQSVSVVTEDQIRDQNITKMEEAIRYVPGVNVHQGENNRDQVVIRGNSTSADFFIDGARDDVQYYRDFYNIGSVEVLKGPNALAFGRGGSGGVINRIPKYADDQQHRRLVVTGGSFNDSRFETDLGGNVNNNLSLRLNAMYEKSNTFRQFGDLERSGISPVATLMLSKNTNIKFGYERFMDQRFNDRGIPSSNGGAFKTSPKQFFGDPNENKSDSSLDSVYTIITHDFDRSLRFRNYSRYSHNYKFYQNVLVASAVDSSNNFTVSAYNNFLERDSFTNQTDLIKKFETGSLQHKALLGGEITKQTNRAIRNTGYFNNISTTQTLSAADPISYTPVTYRQSATDANNHSGINVFALYTQDQIDINKYLQLTGGLRYDSIETYLFDNRSGQNFGRRDGLVSPRAAIVVKPKESLSLYSSYSVSYLPSSGDQFNSLNAASQLLKPEKLENYEVGVKWDVTKRLNLASAIYQLNRKNTRANDPNNPGFFVATGGSRTNGFEFSATGKITDKWQMIASYAFQDAIITSTTSTAQKGQIVALVPRNTSGLWNKYDFTPKLAAGLGIINQSSQFAAVDNAVKLKGFTRFDAAAYYKLNPSYRLQLNVENIFNRGYIQTADNDNNIQPGSTRAFKASLVADF